MTLMEELPSVWHTVTEKLAKAHWRGSALASGGAMIGAEIIAAITAPVARRGIRYLCLIVIRALFQPTPLNDPVLFVI